MAQDFSDLIKVTELLQERALDTHRRNVAESQRLRHELDQIDTLRAAVQADASSVGARRLSGADTLWQTWLVRKRAEILQDMAIARAREFDSMARARTANARADAAQTLEAEKQRELRDKRAFQAAETIETLGRLRHALAQDR